MGKTKGIKALNELVKQFDSVLPTLSGKPQADILCEKSSVLRQIIEIEREDEDAKTEQDAADAAEKIAELTQQLADSVAKVASLSAEVTRLSNVQPVIEKVPDKEHASVRAERDILKAVLAALASKMSPEDCAEAVVKFALGCDQRDVVEKFAASLNIPTVWLWHTLGLPQPTLESQTTGSGIGGILARAVQKVKFPESDKPAGPVEPVKPAGPDLRTLEQKNADAIEAAKRAVGYVPAYIRHDDFAVEKARTRPTY
jgi:hypothetical protein